MTKQVDLEVEIREEKGKEIAKKLRKDGFIPAVFYGKGAENINLFVNTRDFRSALKKSEAKLHSIFNLKIKGKDKELEEIVIINDYQVDPLKDNFLHIDFMKINIKEQIHTKIIVNLIGESPALKQGLILSQQIHELSIKCLPLEIPPHIEVDVSSLENAHDAIRVKDLQLENIIIEMPEDQIIVHAEVPRAMKSAEPEEAEGAVAAEGEEGATAKESGKPAEGDDKKSAEDDAKAAEAQKGKSEKK